MPDLQVIALIPARPASRDVVRDALTTLAAASVRHEGCVDYAVHESAAAPGTFVTVETWRSQQDLDAHLATQDVATAMASAQGHLAGDIAVHPLSPVAG